MGIARFSWAEASLPGHVKLGVCQKVNMQVALHVPGRTPGHDPGLDCAHTAICMRGVVLLHIFKAHKVEEKLDLSDGALFWRVILLVSQR
jgi:hypothetical protein